MPVDPMHPDTYEEEDTGPAEVGVEAPEADAVEQLADLAPQSDEARVDPDVANEADAVEQARVVAIDEDDYR